MSVSTESVEIALDRIGDKLEELLQHLAAAPGSDDPPRWWLAIDGNRVIPSLQPLPDFCDPARDAVELANSHTAERARFESMLRWRAFHASAMRKALEP